MGLRQAFSQSALCGMVALLCLGCPSAAQAKRNVSPLPWVARPHPKPVPPATLAIHPKILAGPNDIVGPGRALSGDTIMVDGSIFRLWGIAAPGMDEFGGNTSKTGLIDMIIDQTVVCSPTGEVVDHHRVARCHVGDRDLSADLVGRGFARDCPRQSDGTYAALERQALTDVAGGFDLPDGCAADF